MSSLESLEHHEHAAHAAEGGAKHAALLVAILAALLALTEVQVKHAEIRVDQDAISAADSWNQYQGKSVREAVSKDLAGLAATLDNPTDAAKAASRAKLLAAYQSDAERYERDPKDGKQAIAGRARGFEADRDATLERAHGFDNAAASFEIGIVLATASAITSARLLLVLAVLLGGAGIALAILAFLYPEWAVL